MAGTIEQRIRDLDISLFDDVVTQLRLNDRKSLLALHTACRDAYGSFTYLEIGSYLGGSLQAFVRDPACEAIVSIDPRPSSAADLRGEDARYPDNTTRGMLERLAAIPGADAAKITTLEASTEGLDPLALPCRPQLCLVDGEHTDGAALRDAEFCLEAMQGDGCIAFDDPNIVYKAIRALTDRLEAGGREIHAYLLPYSIFVVEVGAARLLPHPAVQGRLAESWRGYLMGMLDNDHHRMAANGRAARWLRRLRYGRASP